jgi:hypothetical protein
MSYMLIMKNDRSALVAIGPVSIEYQAALLRDDIENSSGWTGYGIAQVLTEAQARSMTGSAPDDAAAPGASPSSGGTGPSSGTEPGGR